jgi:DNA-binding CsgD family transcriptional regulator/tetratricopeptide (TPR) repeat protein
MEAPAGQVFVGRARELGRLERALDAARAGSGATVLVAGEAGIGKTRLAAELAARARQAGFEVLLGRSIDLVGTELPYQPFVEALRPLGAFPQADGQAAGSQLRVFQETLALLFDRAAAAPLLLVLEDLHWADTSTLDLVVYLAHNLRARRVLLLGTCRAEEPSSAARVRRLADGVRRSGAALVVELGPLDREEVAALLAARAGGAPPAALTDAIVARSEGNPFFAEELLAAGDRDGELPRGLRDVLLQRVARLDRRTQGLLRLAAAAGRDVGYPLLRAVAAAPEREVRESLRQAVEHGVLVAEQATGSFRFRHALLAEAVYATLLPGEREELHARLAEELARGGAGAAELAPHWAAAGRGVEALAASVEAARQAEAVFGLAEALAHLERALALWQAVPDAAELVRLDLAELCSWAAELASQTGAAPRAVELTRRAIGLVGEGDPLRAARLHDRLGRYLHESGSTDAALAAFERVVDLVPAEPPSAERAHALAALGHGLSLAWRFDESLAVCERAFALARTVGDGAVELRALLDLGRDLAYLGRAEEGVARLRRALELAEEAVDPRAHGRGYGSPLRDAYVSLTDVLTMLGRPRESARIGQRGLEAVRRYGVDSTVLVANLIEALLATGEWDEAETLSAAALRAITANFPYMLLMDRADLELGRGDFGAARAHLDAALATLREDRGQGIYDVYLAELALWERRWTDADQAVRDGLARARSRGAAQLRVWFCAKGLRAQAELAALARARRDADAVRAWLDRAAELIAVARRAAAEAAAVTPNAAGWLALAEAEHERARGVARPERWSDAADAWERLERPPLAAYCRWRQAEALVAAGASRAEASGPLGQAHAVAARLGARPLAGELELLAQRARLELAAPAAGPPGGKEGLGALLGLTPREAEVLALVARGYTNREIAASLVISVRTAGVHVSHILRKLGAPNRLEAAAIAHRLSPPHPRQPALDG